LVIIEAHAYILVIIKVVRSPRIMASKFDVSYFCNNWEFIMLMFVAAALTYAEVGG